MPTTITHAVIGAAWAKLFPKQTASWRIYLGSIICSVLADADVIAFSLGIPYGHVLGHRGLSHSIFFALILSFVVVFCLFSKLKLFSGTWWAFVCFFFIVGASHGILDALTNGGLGIAFFAPFDNTRYFFPWTPLPVSSIGLSVMAIRWKLRVLLYEIIHIWLPISMILMTVHIAGCAFKRKT
ncbi:MAG: metal-dependent hydrolase [Planctomycetes bacterium]|nr:metal-dependent hydrolase [Planctomycetota bacterium]